MNPTGDYPCPICGHIITLRQHRHYRNRTYQCPECGQPGLELWGGNFTVRRSDRPTCCDTPLQLTRRRASTWQCARCRLAYYDPDAPRKPLEEIAQSARHFPEATPC